MKLTPEQLQHDLAYFTGTEHYYRYSVLFRNFVLTDGVKFLAEEAGAYWLLDAICSYYPQYKDEGFVVAKLFKFKDEWKEGWKLTLDDGNDNTLTEQVIEYSDFPLDEMTLYVVPQDDLWVILLPSEY